ncbi:MAG: cold shock domain-containing protein [Erysipelothrix sp.]|jgi:CspA family cold shock protein|nr:cold shock domain-containing protein [Erysipelothrix sp.]
MQEKELTHGKVKKFNKEKGYGFIKLEDDRDVFFHYSQLVMEGFKTIEEDAEVEFELVEGERGLQAHNIVKL